MIRQILSTIFIAVGIGFLCQLAQDWAGSYYFNDFLRDNLINLLVALLAVNSATMGIVLTKIRDLIETHGHGEVFRKTRSQMLLSVKEQVCLIVISIALLTATDSIYITELSNLSLLLNSLIAGIFVYAILVLYDTASGVLIIVDFDPNA